MPTPHISSLQSSTTRSPFAGRSSACCARQGFAVETFPSGAEFLLSLPEHQPACLVLDLHMPDLSGLDVQLLIKREASKCRS
jgi:FixJ family two-component response regulator